MAVLLDVDVHVDRDDAGGVDGHAGNLRQGSSVRDLALEQRGEDGRRGGRRAAGPSRSPSSAWTPSTRVVASSGVSVTCPRSRHHRSVGGPRCSRCARARRGRRTGAGWRTGRAPPSAGRVRGRWRRRRRRRSRHPARPASTPPATARPAAGWPGGPAPRPAAGPVACRARCRRPSRVSTAASAVRSPGTDLDQRDDLGRVERVPDEHRSGCRAARGRSSAAAGPRSWRRGRRRVRRPSSSSPNRVCLRSSRSGPFSCTNPAGPAAGTGGTGAANVRLPTGAGPSWPGNGPSAAHEVGAPARSSAPGAGSKGARTCRPRDRNSAVQPTPITPVPTTATCRSRQPPPCPRRCRCGVGPGGVPGRAHAGVPETRRTNRVERAVGRRARRGRRRRRRPRRAGSASRGPPASCRCGCAARPAPPRPGPGTWRGVSSRRSAVRMRAARASSRGVPAAGLHEQQQLAVAAGGSSRCTTSESSTSGSSSTTR